MKMIDAKIHGPLERTYGLDYGTQNRAEKRAMAHMTAGRRVREARSMYNELRRWAIAMNDEAIGFNLYKKFFPYVRMDKPLALSAKKSDELRELYDLTRKDIIEAHREDAIERANEEEKLLSIMRGA